MFHHVVHFSLKDPAQVADTAARIRAMAPLIDELEVCEVGVDELGTPRAVHICLITRFADRAAYDRYAVHPEHKKVLAHMATVVESATVVDWTA